MLRRLTAALLPLIALSTACTTVVPVRDAPGAYVTARAPGMVWITKADSSVVQLAAPKILGDTLTGFVGADYIELPLSSVQSMRARQPAPKRARAVSPTMCTARERNGSRSALFKRASQPAGQLASQ